LIFFISTSCMILSLIIVLSYLRFRTLSGKDLINKHDKTWSYASWLIHKTKLVFKISTRANIKKTYNSWKTNHYSGSKKWIFIGSTLSYLILSISGFLFSALGLIRLHGVPLLIHVSFGGIFAACAAMTLLFRSGDYQFESSPFRISGFFWLFVLSVFILIVTALAMMLPFVSLLWIQTAFVFHRYFAIISVISISFLIFFSLTKSDNK